MSESQLYEESARAGHPARPAGGAAWLRKRRGAIEIGPASYTPPKENEITVKNGAVAVNPLDWGIQLAGNFLYRWLKYPAVLGTAPSRPASTRPPRNPQVVGHGLRHIQAAMDAQMKGVSAAKIVVSLDGR